MLTQTIQINLTQSKLSSIIMRSEEKGREITFSVIDEAGDPVVLEDYSVKFLMVKPDENVVYSDVVSGVLTQTEQMTTSKGAGYYCIRIIDAGTVIYSGQGRVLIDDHVIDDETLDSISEVDGYIFPDDFATIPWVEEYVNEHTSGSVIANPDTPPTDTLETVTIEDITYDIIHPAEEKSGNPIEITDAAAAPLVKCVSAITGSQDLHGYDKPWVGGAGKNKIDLIDASLESGKIIISNGTIKINGSFSSKLVNLSSYVNLAFLNDNIINKQITYSITIVDGEFNASSIFFSAQDSTYYIQMSNSTRKTTETPTKELTVFRLFLNGTFDCEFKLQIEINADATSWTPYSNICPITAYTEGEIYVSDGDGNTTTHTTTYPSAIYRGSEDVVKGEVVTEWGMIASYAGETLPGEWISDRDEYAPGTTPTTGAQVAYKLATPTTSSVTPTNLPIKSILGYNHIESSTGEMEVEYIIQRFQPLIDSIKQL